MIEYEERRLDNGLQVILHRDTSTPLAVVNLLYKVGSRNENPQHTGFAHLFEHLMFGGSRHVPDFDGTLQQVGGDNNAFTNTDITNYYITLPAENLETALWVESDRMKHLNIDQHVLDVQKNVVIEEFKQRYINQPYGDVWFHLRAMAYQEHPYMWPTIGKDIAHIEQASLEEVLNFYQQFYTPQNAVLVVSGNIDCEHAFSLVDRWFSDIAKPDIPLIKIPEEPVQSMGRRKEVQAKVPLDAFYKVYHMPGRYSPGYYSCDLISDMLGHGKSSRLYRRLVKENPIFSHLSAQILGSVDPGLLVVSGMLNQGRELEEAEEAVQNVIEAALNSEPFSEEELHAAKSQAELQISFGFSELMNRSVNLAQCKALGDASLINREFDLIKGVSLQHAHHWAQHVLKEENSSTLYYRASNHEQ